MSPYIASAVVPLAFCVLLSSADSRYGSSWLSCRSLHMRSALPLDEDRYAFIFDDSGATVSGSWISTPVVSGPVPDGFFLFSTGSMETDSITASPIIRSPSFCLSVRLSLMFRIIITLSE